MTIPANWSQISFKKVPVAFRDSFVPQQKLYYTLEAMGKADELTPKIFQAIHVENQRINTDKTILAWKGDSPRWKLLINTP